ncbi:MAG: hypothetical protein FWE84_00155 [Firmicutes bacterium]|nr:hypothetical protein [Bacillota bacterium]
MQKLTSGQIAPWTGEYSVISRNGRTVGTIHVNKGDRLPPTQSDGDHFEYSSKK